MNALGRILGLQTVGGLALLLPARHARAVGAWQGWMSFGDVFVVSWLETVVVWFFALLKIAMDIVLYLRVQNGVARASVPA